MKKWLTVIGSIVLYILTIGICFTNKIMYIRKKTDDELWERELNTGFFARNQYDSLKRETFTIHSPLGYLLRGTLIHQHETNKFLIICHGVTVNSISSIKYSNLFLRKGWNVVLYDHRRHGQSEGRTTSYGYYEKFDLKAVVDWTKTRFGNEIVLGIHGESMGAVTTILYAGALEDGADFYIVDCPFSDFEEQLAHRLKKEYRLPRHFVLPIANLFLKVRDGYSFRDVSPIRVIHNIQKPVLFIHSAQDEYILPQMTKILYEKKPGAKQLFYAPLGAHACSYAENRPAYEEAIERFLNQYSLQ